jgi:hypothetical protein
MVHARWTGLAGIRNCFLIARLHRDGVMHGQELALLSKLPNERLGDRQEVHSSQLAAYQLV